MTAANKSGGMLTRLAHGAGEKLVTELWPEQGHQFTAAQQQRVWRWLEEVFGSGVAEEVSSSE